jgi:hypothetical protein
MLLILHRIQTRAQPRQETLLPALTQSPTRRQCLPTLTRQLRGKPRKAKLRKLLQTALCRKYDTDKTCSGFWSSFYITTDSKLRI